MSCGPEIANHDLSFYLYIYCIPTYNLLMTAHIGYRRGVFFWVCEIPLIYVFCYLFLEPATTSYFTSWSCCRHHCLQLDYIILISSPTMSWWSTLWQEKDITAYNQFSFERRPTTWSSSTSHHNSYIALFKQRGIYRSIPLCPRTQTYITDAISSWSRFRSGCPGQLQCWCM